MEAATYYFVPPIGSRTANANKMQSRMFGRVREIVYLCRQIKKSNGYDEEMVDSFGDAAVRGMRTGGTRVCDAGGVDVAVQGIPGWQAVGHHDGRRGGAWAYL